MFAFILDTLSLRRWKQDLREERKKGRKEKGEEGKKGKKRKGKEKKGKKENKGKRKTGFLHSYMVNMYDFIK